MKNIKIKIVTPERTVYEDEVSQATLPTIDGEVTILPDHIPYITALKAGEIMLKKGEETIHLATSGGFIEFNNNLCCCFVPGSLVGSFCNSCFILIDNL